MDKPSYLNFDKTKYAWKPNVDYREHPELYRVGKGEQGVLICEPYKGELVPLWRFKTPDIARESSRAIYKNFLAYLREGDYVGADMARKFLQKGFPRSFARCPPGPDNDTFPANRSSRRHRSTSPGSGRADRSSPAARLGRLAPRSRGNGRGLVVRCLGAACGRLCDSC
jgi:hypothetical protein